ncbi:hypothetical protein 1 [Lactuca sativa marnavirus]|nr:hypothetical protein 1 [Lactuca sativa marnavirus]
MCEFHYDFESNEPFYYCDHENCDFQDEDEDGFLTVSIAVGKNELSDWSKMVTFKLDPGVKVKILASWLDVQGDLDGLPMFYRGQRLAKERVLGSYGIANGEYIFVRSVWPHSISLNLAPRILRDEDPQSWPHFVRWRVSDFVDKWTLQSDEDVPVCEEIVERLRNARSTFLSTDDVWIFELIENLFQTIYWLRKCENTRDFAAVAHLSYKLFTGKTFSHQCKNFLLQKGSILQSDFEEYIKKFRGVFNLTTAAMGSPLVKKIHDLYTYLLVQGFLSKFGMEISDKEFQLLASKMGKSYKQPTALLVCVVDTSLLICEKLVDFRKTRDPTVFIHSSTTYSAWLEKADKLLELAPFTSNLGAHGTSYFSFVADLDDVIEKGEAICKHSKGNLGVESTILSRKLHSLKLLKNIEITRRASQKEREAPFGVLVHGASSVGKSTFTKMLYYYYGSLHGLDKDDHFRYVRNPADEYWSNFDSSKWCIQMDDIAFLLPSKSNEVDPTLKEMLNVVNNVPYVPPQAALEDKGKTPVLAKLVVATTNAKDLNAHEYFYCPLAVRRRLPYVVHVVPKEEYLHANKKFLDTESLPDFSGTYPDFWEIAVQKIVPVECAGRDRARLETVARFDDVRKFLAHFGKASYDHLHIQDKSHVCDAGMREISVCPLCFEIKESCSCLQVGENASRRAVATRALYELCCSYFVWTLSFSWVLSYIRFVARVRIIRKCIARLSNMMNGKIQIQVFGLLNGVPVSKEFKYALLALSSFGVMLYVCTRSSKKKDDASSMVPQGNKFGTTERDLPTEATQNVWHDSTMELSSFDVPRASLSNVALDGPKVRDLFSHNCVRLHISALDENYSCRTGGVFVRGQFLLFNGHVVHRGSRYKIEIQDMVNQGLSSNHTIEISKKDITFDSTLDLACLQVMSMPPFKDISKYWNEGNIPVTRILSVRRKNEGDVTYHHIYGVNFVSAFPIEALNIKVPMYMGKSEIITQPGDCGSLGVALTPRGPVIMGMHTVGYNNMCGFPHVTKSQIEKIISRSVRVPHAHGGGSPVLSLNGDVSLVPPHYKSLFRFIPKGTAKVYGSFPGFRPKPKSRVVRTPICGKVLEYFGTTVKHGKPAMDGWEPWRKNVIEMVQPTVNYDRDILESAKNMFYNEIIAGLPPNWEKELVILSRKATVNGLPGVKFIDRLNCNSSMGHPWNTTKKKFLKPDPCEFYPEGVDFEDDIWKEADRVEQIYSQGGRAFPIYTGHLKDEPTVLSKCEAKKTRVFTGSSVPFSLVVRKYLLSFVRLVQKNKFTFEAGPGTVVQSMEWTEIYEYLTRFGADQMIAGDYGKFDKRMIADFILHAFDIIIKLHAHAGFEEGVLSVLRGIAADTAFPVVNLNGDLTEFFGTNPSGHPLTVIINSLVNSLYMRYAYISLSRKNGVKHTKFKDFVALLTYGDDNALGVSMEIPWFNHTTIQSELSAIGVEYTMADKSSESIPYIHIDDVTFLKRRWVYDKDVGAWLAPLEEESIHKSLTTWIPSGTIDQYAQVVAVIQSANSEYFFYGKSIFERHHKFFRELLAIEPYCHYVTETTLPGWGELVDRFWKASGKTTPSA